jgi:hypothetical protein
VEIEDHRCAALSTSAEDTYSVRARGLAHGSGRLSALGKRAEDRGPEQGEAEERLLDPLHAPQLQRCVAGLHRSRFTEELMMRVPLSLCTLTLSLDVAELCYKLVILCVSVWFVVRRLGRSS